MLKGFMLCSLLLLYAIGCKTLDKPAEFVDSLRSPTSFPDLFFPTVKDVDEIIRENELLEAENFKITPVGKNKSASLHVVQIREGAEMGYYSHNLHDELVYVHSGGGIIELNNTRHKMEKGMVLMIPRKTWHKLINTGGGPLSAISFFSPPFSNDDIKFLKQTKVTKKKKKSIYDKAMKKSVTAEGKESEEKKKWLGLWGKGDEKTNLKEGEQPIEEIEERKILVLTDEGKRRIKEVQDKMGERERLMLEKMIIGERVKVLQKLKVEGLISQEEFELKRDEIINESKLKRDEIIDESN
ncbi:MAG: cupin domain-containing protein [Candidatus Scalindua sp. AMX11]|nr:MAG: cupin domain-containing protein [Candidatus Scalindua sp.]TDE64062.1 MAG: cupin domain-containing protein [Candidatus Scalindua sp. AMX11]